MLAFVVQMGNGLMLVPVGSALPPFGGGSPAGPDPGYGIPTVPHPGHDLPAGPGHPEHGLPPLPPDPVHPGHPLPLPPQIDNTLPIYPARPDHALPPPGTIYPPLPPNVPTGKALVLVAISGVGYRWTVIDTSLSAGTPLPGGPPPIAGQPLPPTAAPKR